MPHWLHTHTHWGKLRPSRMFPDPICVTTEVIAAWDARSDELFLTGEGGRGRKVPYGDPATVSAVHQIWATRLALRMREAGSSICSRGIFMTGWLSCFAPVPQPCVSSLGHSVVSIWEVVSMSAGHSDRVIMIGHSRNICWIWHTVKHSICTPSHLKSAGEQLDLVVAALYSANPSHTLIVDSSLTTSTGFIYDCSI